MLLFFSLSHWTYSWTRRRIPYGAKEKDSPDLSFLPLIYFLASSTIHVHSWGENWLYSLLLIVKVFRVWLQGTFERAWSGIWIKMEDRLPCRSENKGAKKPLWNIWRSHALQKGIFMLVFWIFCYCRSLQMHEPNWSKKRRGKQECLFCAKWKKALWIGLSVSPERASDFSFCFGVPVSKKCTNTLSHFFDLVSKDEVTYLPTYLHAMPCFLCFW